MKWWRARSPRERRAVLTGAALTVLAVGYARVARPVVAHAVELRSTVQRERDIDARERALLSAAGRHGARLARAEEALDDARETIFVASDTLAAVAALSRYVRELAEETGTALQGAEPQEPAAGPGALTAIRIRLRATGDLQGLLELVEALRNGSRIVRIRSLGITPEQSSPAWESPEREALILAADLEAWALLGEVPE